jgi:hypothetical protein
MSAPRKTYFDPKNPPIPRLDGEHLVIPFPALQGLLRALLSRWNIDDDEKKRMENQLIMAACSLADPRCLKMCEEDKDPVQEKSIQRVADHFIKTIRDPGKSCPTWLLQVQAQAIDQLLEKSIYSKLKDARNPASVSQLLREHLPPVQERVFVSSSFHCRKNKPHPCTLPPDDTLSKWGRISQPSRLRNTIIAYYHGQSPDYLKQVLAGRTDQF